MSIVINPARCCGCESCIAVCPVGAIKIKAAKAELEAEKCISCGACINECFYDAVTMSREPVGNKK